VQQVKKEYEYEQPYLRLPLPVPVFEPRPEEELKEGPATYVVDFVVEPESNPRVIILEM